MHTRDAKQPLWHLGRVLSQLDTKLHQMRIHHIPGHELHESIGYGVEHMLTHIVVLDIQRHAAPGKIISVNRTHVLTLPLGEESQLHLGNDGESSIGIYNTDQGLYTAGLVDLPALAAALAKLNALSRRHCTSFMIHICSCSRFSGRKTGSLRQHSSDRYTQKRSV